MMCLKYLLITIMVNIVRMQSCSKKEVDKNGSSYTFHKSFIYTLNVPMELRWLHNNESVSLCVGYECFDDYPNNTITSITYIEENHTVSCEITVFNGTKDCSGDWSLQYMGVAYMEHPGELFECKLPFVDDQAKTTTYRSTVMPENHEMKYTSLRLMLPFVIVITMSAIAVTIVVAVIIAMKRKHTDRKKKELLFAEISTDPTQILLVQAV